MISISSYNLFSQWSFGPIIISSFTLLYIAFLLYMYPSKRNSVVYTALTGAIAGSLLNTFITVNFYRWSTHNIEAVESIPFLVYGIYTAFTFVPGLIGFHHIATKNKDPVSKFLIHFGYLCAIITVVIGLALTTYITIKRSNLEGFGAEREFTIQKIDRLISYMDICCHVFVFTWSLP